MGWKPKGNSSCVNQKALNTPEEDSRWGQKFPDRCCCFIKQINISGTAQQICGYCCGCCSWLAAFKSPWGVSQGVNKKKTCSWVTDSVWAEHAPLSWGQRVLVGIGRSPGACLPLNQTSAWLVLRAVAFCSQNIIASSVCLKICMVFHSGFSNSKGHSGFRYWDGFMG